MPPNYAAPEVPRQSKPAPALSLGGSGNLPDPAGDPPAGILRRPNSRTHPTIIALLHSAFLAVPKPGEGRSIQKKAG